MLGGWAADTACMVQQVVAARIAAAVLAKEKLRIFLLK
jgi:hypothetical protein